MNLTRVFLRNILGIENLDFQPGKVTRITGRNGSGKTSVLDAIRSVFERGTDPTLRRVGSDKGEVILEVTDGDVTHKVRRAVTEKGDRTTVDNEASGKTWLQQIAEAARINPIAFIQAKPAERTELLLRAAAVSFPRESLAAAVKPVLDHADGALLRDKIKQAVERASNPFERIEAVKSAIFDWRTGVNRSYKDASRTAEQLRESLPAGGEYDTDKVTAELSTAKALREQAGVNRLERESAIKEGAEEQIRAIERDRDQQLAALREKYQAEIDTHNAGIARLEAIRDRLIETTKARQLYGEMTDKAKRLDSESLSCTQALAQIDKIKVELLATLPVPGVEILYGEIYKDGVPFDRLNTQQKIDVAVTVAERLPGDLNLCMIDGFECFDPEHQAAFIERARKSPLQFIIASVGEGDLQVKEEVAA